MISHETINGLVKYFEAKESRTEQEQEFLDELNNYSDIFPITGVSRDDLADRGFDGNKVTDEQMERLANKMSDDYLEQLFWCSMETLADCLEFPRKATRIVKVDWDTDGKQVGLPTEVEVPCDVEEEDVTEWLSDNYGYCLFGWSDVNKNNDK